MKIIRNIFITLNIFFMLVLTNNYKATANDVNSGTVSCIRNLWYTAMNDGGIKKMNKIQQKQAIVNMYFPYFDLEWTAKMSIGINYKKMSTKQQENYLKEFSKFFAYIWLPSLYVDNASGARLVIKDKTTKINSDEYVDVVIYAPDGKTFDLRLRVRNKPEWKHCKILNAVFDGVDLAMSYRAQFDAYIEEHNGKSETIIDYLVKKNQQYKKTSGIVLPIE